MAFENDFSSSLWKCVCVWGEIIVKSRASVSDKNGLPQGEGRMGARKK